MTMIDTQRLGGAIKLIVPNAELASEIEYHMHSVDYDDPADAPTYGEAVWEVFGRYEQRIVDHGVGDLSKIERDALRQIRLALIQIGEAVPRDDMYIGRTWFRLGGKTYVAA